MSQPRNERIVAYVDILGWSEACCSTAPDVMSRVAIAAGIVKSNASNYSEAGKAQVYQHGSFVHRNYFDIEWAAISDCFVLSMPASTGARIIPPLAEICRQLLRHNFLTRGALTIGDLHHVENMVFGPALVEAVQLEKSAIYPRVVVSPAARQAIEAVVTGEDDLIRDALCRTPLIEDALGRQVVNIFSFGSNLYDLAAGDCYAAADEWWGMKDIGGWITQQVEQFTKQGDAARAEKWRYMMGLFRQGVDDLRGGATASSPADK